MSMILPYRDDRIVIAQKSPTDVLGPDDEIKYELARRSLKEFIKLVFPTYKFNWHHEYIIETLEEFFDPDSGLDRLIIQSPPRVGKSELLKLFCAWAFGNNPDEKIIYTSYGADLAQQANRDVQRYIDTDVYRKIFPWTFLNNSNVKTSARGSYIRTANKFEIVGHDGMMRTVGVGGGLTGEGATTAIADDLIKDWEEAISPNRKEMISNWYDSTFLSRLSGKKRKVILNMTRWAPDDQIGRVLEKMEKSKKASRYEVISFPMLFEESEYNHPLDTREDGDPLWPEMFPKDMCLQMKTDYSSRVWGSLYQQRPRPDKGSLIQRNWWKFYAVDPSELDLDYYSISWDFTFKDGKKSDYVVGQVWGKRGAQYYLLDQIRDKMSFSATVQAVQQLCAKWPDYREVLVEAKANGEAVIDTLKQKIHGIVPYNPKESKDSRAASITPLIEAGNVYLPDPLIKAWVKDYIDEWSFYPNAAHDDQIDATSQMLIRMKKNKGWIDKLGKEEDGLVVTESREDYVLNLLNRKGHSSLNF